MNLVPDPRAVEKWLWSRYLLSWGAVLFPISLAGFLTGAYFFPFDEGSIGYYTVLGLTAILLFGSTLMVGDLIIDRRDTWKFWCVYVESDLRSRAAKIRADSVLLDYNLAHQPPREVDA
jgi:hypothetical protein